MSNESVSITLHAQACLYLFKAVSSHLQSTGISYQAFITYNDFHDELGRFNLWLQDSGALREGLRSLDRRLSESSYVSVPVLHLLKDLRQALEEGRSHYYTCQAMLIMFSTCDCWGQETAANLYTVDMVQ